MIFVEWGDAAAETLEDAAVLIANLRDAGLPAVVPPGALPPDLGFAAAYEIARHVAAAPAGPADTLLILGAQAVADARMAGLRRRAQHGVGRLLAAGRFADAQAEFAVRAKLGYALGREPDLLRLPGEDAAPFGHPAAPVFGVDRGRLAGRDGRLRVLLVDSAFEEPGAHRALQALAASRRLETTLLTNGKTKTELLAKGVGLPVYHYGEAPPGALARRTDVAVFCGPIPKGYRVRMMLADFAASGIGLFDASDGFQLRRVDPAFVPAPRDPVALAAFLVGEILPAAGDLAELARGSATAAQGRAALAAVRAGLGLGDAAPAAPVRPKRRAAARAAGRVVFLPTNGVGLGHAQRCALIAGHLDRVETEPVFAAFPSCGAMLKSYGFDVMPLVAKTALHASPGANDVVNYRRIDGLLAGAAAFVFDGGYVFNSVFRSVLDAGVPSVWIRRGLWQGGQDNGLALEREKVFDRVIVPREAFDELNRSYSAGEAVREVGPIVQRTELGEEARVRLRAALAERFGRRFSALVVTMLGGGVAADRSAQTVALAAALARRRDALHLVVVWPTATIDPGLFGWPNTRVVKTHHAAALVRAADLYVSAAGYNSFHEAIYDGTPTIFVPQMAAYMDDQRARAAAAAERGLAVLVEPHEIMALDAAAHRMLDGEAAELRARLKLADLPEPGCAAAAGLIAAVAGARAGARLTRRVA